jgi:hypothetical protein
MHRPPGSRVGEWTCPGQGSNPRPHGPGLERIQRSHTPCAVFRVAAACAPSAGPPPGPSEVAAMESSFDLARYLVRKVGIRMNFGQTGLDLDTDPALPARCPRRPPEACIQVDIVYHIVVMSVFRSHSMPQN